MFNNQLIFPQALPWFFLFITIVIAFSKPKYWPYGLVITLMTAFFYNAINITGTIVIVVLLALSYFAKTSSHQILRHTCTTLVIILCIALAAHLLPGFNNLLVLDNVEKGTHSIAFSMYLNLDKPMILFVLLCLQPTILQNKNQALCFKKLNTWQVIAIICTAMIVIFSLAASLSLIKIDVGLPSWWWVFALNNLILTCVVEEVFFRGFIQQQLGQKFNELIALVIASLLFGLAHFAGGLGYILVAILAGFLYGFIYQSTGKIRYAILGHFGLNILHLWLFTYPMMKVS